jgi:NADPH:quinone reductase-like Zn-dependent oxidoreductase
MMNRAISQQKLKPVVDQVFSYADVPAALQRMQSGAHFGKLVTSVKY